MNFNSYFLGKQSPEQKIKEALSGEYAESYLFGNKGLVIYKDGVLQYTSEDASAKAGKTIRRLNKDTANPYSSHLADSLSSCAAFNRCLSGACANCNRAANRMLCEAGMELVADKPSGYVVVSIIPLDRRYVEDLARNASGDIHDLKARTTRVFNRAGIRIALGGVDISVNSHEDGKFTEHYKWHFWMLVKTPNIEQLKALLKEEFSSSPSVPVPIMVKPYDGRVNALSYALKYTFQQRISRENEIAADGSEKRLAPKTDRLRNHEHIEIAHALDELGLAGRMFLHGISIGMVDGLPCFIPNTQGKGG